MEAKTVLFLCTGNYYRSRFAEIFFNSVAESMGLGWRAVSRGLALERGIYNIGPMSRTAVEILQAMGISSEEFSRFPVPAVAGDFEAAHLVVALKEAEHLPLLQERFPAWAAKVEFWHVDDVHGALVHVEREVRELAKRLA